MRPRVRALAGLVAALALAGCEGVQGASTFAKRQAFNANFSQVPLVDASVDADRTLQMYVFTDRGQSSGRRGYAVKFSAAVAR